MGNIRASKGKYILNSLDNGQSTKQGVAFDSIK